jgi:hypothetical protein
VRAVLLTLFEGFTLRRVADPFDRDVFSPVLMGLGDGYELQPDVREDAIAGFEPSGVTADRAFGTRREFHRRLADVVVGATA